MMKDPLCRDKVHEEALAEPQRVRLDGLLDVIQLPTDGPINGCMESWRQLIEGMTQRIGTDDYLARLKARTASYERTIDTTVYKSVPEALVRIAQSAIDGAYHEICEVTAEDRKIPFTFWLGHTARRMMLLSEGNCREEWQTELAEMRDFLIADFPTERYRIARDAAEQFFQNERRLCQIRSFWRSANNGEEEFINSYLEQRPGDLKGCFEQYRAMRW